MAGAAVAGVVRILARFALRKPEVELGRAAASPDVKLVLDERAWNQSVERLDKGPMHRARVRAVARLAGGMRREAARIVKVDRGRLRQSLGEVVDPARAEAFVVSKARHALPVLDGSRPHRAPVAPIKRWARRHGVPWFPVWRKIAREGTKPHDYVTAPFQHMRARAPRVIAEEMKRAGVSK